MVDVEGLVIGMTFVGARGMAMTPGDKVQKVCWDLQLLGCSTSVLVSGCIYK